MIRKIIKNFNNPKIILLYIMGWPIFRIMPDRMFLKIKYYLLIGKKLNLNNPKAFNEKLQWLKLNDRKDIYTTMVDKFMAKEYVSNIIGEKYIIPTLNIYDKFEDINFNELPDKFVLKPTHTSGNVFVCKDKQTIDYKKLKKEVNRWLRREYYYYHREWPYKNVKPRIIAEEYMEDSNTSDLKDYKFMCFNGQVKCSFVCSNRNSKEGLNVDFYDLNWEKMPFARHYSNSKLDIKKPLNYDLMIELSEKLAKDIPFVRIDFYEVNGKVYFGEITFYPGAGFEEFTPEKYDLMLGEWIKL